MCGKLKGFLMCLSVDGYRSVLSFRCVCLLACRYCVVEFVGIVLCSL